MIPCKIVGWLKSWASCGTIANRMMLHCWRRPSRWVLNPFYREALTEAYLLGRNSREAVLKKVGSEELEGCNR